MKPIGEWKDGGPPVVAEAVRNMLMRECCFAEDVWIVVGWWKSEWVAYLTFWDHQLSYGEIQATLVIPFGFLPTPAWVCDQIGDDVYRRLVTGRRCERSEP